ncbi:hypothetical protein ACFLWA_05245 [Chloroflexota bacterium]
MSSNVIFMGWNRPVPGREGLSVELFQETQQYLAGLQQSGDIGSFQTVLLSNHGGDLNGFILIHGDSAQLDAVASSDEWFGHVTHAGLILDGFGVIRGATGDVLMEWMARWGSFIAEL